MCVCVRTVGGTSCCSLPRRTVDFNPAAPPSGGPIKTQRVKLSIQLDEDRSLKLPKVPQRGRASAAGPATIRFSDPKSIIFANFWTSMFDRFGVVWVMVFGSLFAPFSVPDRSWVSLGVANVEFLKSIQKPIENQQKCLPRRPP